MPTKAVTADTMEVGRKGQGKHWTADEVAARQQAADKLTRKRAATLTPPAWLSKDAVTLWNEKLAQVKGLKASNELLDVLDTELLAMYCDAVIKYRELSRQRLLSTDDIKALQAWSRIIRDCAEKLGFTPSARARLVKKIADESGDTFGKKFD